MVKKLTSIILVVFIYANIVNAKELAIDKKNLSYATAKIKILPLLKLSPKLAITNDNIIFIHPPKVGGTNVVYVIDAIKSIKSHRFAVPRIAGVSPGLITQGWLGGLISLKEQCKETSNNECSKYNFLSGHFPYGAHNYLHNKYQYITLIRHPVEREISSVNFDYQRGYIKNKQEAIKTLIAVMIDNPQTRMLAGESYMSGECNERTLEVAKKNMEKFLLVGVTEDTNSFVQALISILNAEPVAIGKSQVTQDKIFKKLPKEIQSALLNKHQYDLALYKYAKDRWKKWKQANIFSTLPITAQQKILTILPDFANRHEAIYMNNAQIEEYNNSSKGGLVEINQHHHGVQNENLSDKY
jgi:hypothetical protein